MTVESIMMVVLMAKVLTICQGAKLSRRSRCDRSEPLKKKIARHRRTFDFVSVCPPVGGRTNHRNDRKKELPNYLISAWSETT